IQPREFEHRRVIKAGITLWIQFTHGCFHARALASRKSRTFDVCRALARSIHAASSSALSDAALSARTVSRSARSLVATIHTDGSAEFPTICSMTSSAVSDEGV